MGPGVKTSCLDIRVILTKVTRKRFCKATDISFCWKDEFINWGGPAIFPTSRPTAGENQRALENRGIYLLWALVFASFKSKYDDMVKIYIQQEYTANKTKTCRMKSDGEFVIPSNSAKLLFLTEIQKRLIFLFDYFNFSFLCYCFVLHMAGVSTLLGATSLWIFQKFLFHLLHQILFSGNKLISNFILRRHKYKRIWYSPFQRTLHFQRHIPKPRNKFLMFEFWDSGSE